MSVETTSSTLSFRCAPWTREQGVDPIGSALTCDTLLLVETPAPWPRDVSEIPAFAAALRHSRPGGLNRTRLLAVRPADEGIDDLDPRAGVLITRWRRAGSNRFLGIDHTVPRDRLVDALIRLLDAGDRMDAMDATDSTDSANGDTIVQAAPAEVLLCGHGQRDRCCGRNGVRLQIEAASAWPGVRVRRCSHTGGHRFAPTGFTLPDGRAWGFLDASTLDGIVRRSSHPDTLRDRYRGTTALDPWGQVVERELLERFGWGWLDHEITSSRTEVTDGGRAATVELAWCGPTGEASAVAVVEVARDVPVLVCGEPPEVAGKTSPEFALRHITVRS
ncbi:sucrase ferredoxin [Frankia sp. Cas3]|uniref:sucrase ferredoxin n=1 Tax=Frankia sp. Cas3 TaxID=3073926 RepID=UPI002AD2F28B|nr:sucrase ferredoxin [Frankia sp. Cas3]